jgi:hypothetical protein
VGAPISTDKFYDITIDFYQNLKRNVFHNLKAKHIVISEDEFPLAMSTVLYDMEEVGQ